MGKALRCPKCKEAFRAPATQSAAQPTGDSTSHSQTALQPESPSFSNLDFDEAPAAGQRSADQDLYLAPGPDNQTCRTAPRDEQPVDTAPSAMWAAPTREVEVVQGKSTLTKEEAARRQSRREFSLLMVGGAVCGVVALAVVIVGTIVVWRSLQRNAAEALAKGEAVQSEVPAVDAPAGGATLPTLFGFDETKRALMVDYLVSQGNGKPKAKLTMAMVVNAMKKLAADFNIEPKEEFPEQLELLRERVVMRDVPDDLLHSDKVPGVFEKMISAYQANSLGPAEEEVAILVIIAFLGSEM